MSTCVVRLKVLRLKNEGSRGKGTKTVLFKNKAVTVYNNYQTGFYHIQPSTKGL
jgi:hypothetical protein